MFGSQILEVAIGVIFIFILVSIICSVVRESIEAWLKTRAAFLEHGIRELLHDKEATGLVKDFYQHPLIYGLFAADYRPPIARLIKQNEGETAAAYAQRLKEYKPTDEDKKALAKKPSALTKGYELPSYIPTKNFALALMDMAARGPQTDVASSDPAAPRISLEAIRQNVGNLDNPAVQRVVLTALDTAQGDLNQVQANLEAWYDSGMDRVSGWYKRSSQWVIFWIGLFAAISMNINTITIADYLGRNDVARRAVVARVEAATKDPAFQRAVLGHQDSAAVRYYNARKELDSLELPIGWDRGWGAPRQRYQAPEGQFAYWNNVFAPLFGWLLTALAAMLGAPFWFDILNKIMVIRSTVKPHEKSQEEASEDRQLPPPSPTGGAGGGPGGGGGAPPPPGPLVPPAPAAAPDPDGCDVEAAGDDLTTDEDLPAATGGVQQPLQPAH